MAVDLETIVFKSDTTQLREAAERIAALTTAIAALSAQEKSSATVAKETAATIKAKLKLESDLVILKAKLLEAETKAAAASNGTAGANDKAAKKAESLANLLSRLNNTFIDLANGQTRAESSTLQLARTLGASAAQMDQVRASLQQIAGLRTNPFDATLGSLRSIQGELDTLNDRSRLAAQGIALSTNQLKEYSRLGNEIRGQMQGQNLDPTQGSGLAEFNRRLAESQNKYLAIANTVNTLTSEEKKRNEVLTTQRNLMAELEQKNRSIQESINRNTAMTASMQGGMSQSSAGTQYDNAKSMVGATPDQLIRIQERITLTQKLTESEKLLNIEQEKQNELLKHIEGIVAQQKAIQDLNRSVVDNIAERKKMDDLMQKYSGMGLNASGAKELSNLEMKGASQASIESLKTYLLNVQAITKAKADQKAAEDEVEKAAERSARAQAASRYSVAGHSSAISNTAGTMEVKGVPQAVIDSYIRDTTAKEASAKATRELVSATKYVTETEERLAAAVNNANQNLNRQSTDELVKYQKALGLVGTSTDETTRKMAALKAQLDLVAGKERENQLNHLSRAISTQMGDVGISLASGMNPLTVMLQQGDQIRFALQQAGAEGKELQKAMSGAASQIASSVVLTFKAMLGFVGGTVISIGRSFASLWTAPIQFYKDFMAIQAKVASGNITQLERTELQTQSWKMLGTSLSSLGTVLIGITAIMSGVFLIAAAQVIKQEQELSKAIVETGASLGYSKQSAISFAESLGNISTSIAIGAITDFANAGVRGSTATERMMLAAIDLEKYGGTAVTETAKAYARLQGEPIKALQELAEASGRVTSATLEKAKSYKEAGDNAKILALAETETARVTEEKAKAMQSSMSPIQELWIDIKHAISNTWEEIQNLTKSGPIVNTLQVVFQTFAVIVTEAWYAIKGLGMALGALPAIAVAAFTDIKNFDMGFSETKKMASIVNQSSEENKAAYDKAIASILKTGTAVQTVGGMTSKQLQANTEMARSFRIAAEAEEKYLIKSNTLIRARAALEQEYKKAKAQGPEGAAATKLLESAMGNLDKKIKEAKEAEAKKDRGPKAKTSSFSGVPSEESLVNNTPNIQKEYSSELSKQEKFFKSKRDILKLDYEAGLVSRGAYISQDIALIVKGQNKEFEVINSFGEKVKAEQERITASINARRSEALNATKDPASRKKINLAADDEVKKVVEAGKTFTELQTDKTDTIEFESMKRYRESIKEQNLSIIDSKKHLEDLNKTMQDATESRRLDAEFQMKSVSLAGSELESYKARNEVLKDYVKTKDRINNSVNKETVVYTDMVENSDGSKESQDRILQQWQIIQTLKDQVIKAGIDGEEQARKASIDAVNKYYLNKAIEVRDGTANAITEAITNGGQAGSKAIKGVLDNILRDLLNNAFKTILSKVGDMILKSVLQAQAASSVSSSGGGFFESLVKTGLSAAAGSAGGGSTASSGVDYSFSSSGSSISGFRATGGFVNQGSEYMVGENGPEVFTPKQTGSITANHNMSASSDPMKVTIINNTSSQIGKVTERQISPTERALVIEEAVTATAAALHDPNHKLSKSFNQNYTAQRRR